MEEIPFDVSWSFDADSRDVPDNPEDMRAAVQWLRERARRCEDAGGRARLLSRAGAYARMIGDLEASRALLSEAIALAEQQQNPRLVTTSMVRLAHTHQWAGDFKASNSMFAELLDRCMRDGDAHSLLDFVHQHHGKNLLDQGRVDEAVEQFERALAIRREQGDEELIESTERALALARHMQESSR